MPGKTAYPLGLPVGLKGKRGFPTHKITKAAPAKKKSSSKRNTFVRDLIDEVGGFSPYELRAMDLFEISEKRALRFTKRRLGDIRRGKYKLKKLEEMKRKLRRRETERRQEMEAKKQ